MVLLIASIFNVWISYVELTLPSTHLDFYCSLNVERLPRAPLGIGRSWFYSNAAVTPDKKKILISHLVVDGVIVQLGEMLFARR
jgi:hypothetical protein